MPMVATIPVTIQPDAAAFLAEIGMEDELERILEHAKATIPHLRALDVVFHDFPETGPPGLTIDAHRDPFPEGWDRACSVFGRWMVENFSPEVNVNIGLMSYYHGEDER